MRPDYIIDNRPQPQPPGEIDVEQFEVIRYKEVDDGLGLGELALNVAKILLQATGAWLRARIENSRANAENHRRRRERLRKVRKAKQEYREVGTGRTSCSGPRKQHPKRIIRVVIEDY